MAKIILIIIVSLVLLGIFGTLFDIELLLASIGTFGVVLEPIGGLVVVLATLLSFVVEYLGFFLILLGLLAFMRYLLDLVFMKGE